MQTTEQEQAINALQGAYAAFNRGDIAAAAEPLDPEIEWTGVRGPAGSIALGGNQGVAASRRYCAVSLPANQPATPGALQFRPLDLAHAPRRFTLKV